MAEGIFAKLVKNEGLSEHIVVDSAGTGGWHEGEQADYRTRSVSGLHGIQITHRARQFKPSDLREFTYILSMDTSVAKTIENIQRSRPNTNAQLMLMRDFDPERSSNDVPDPYNADETAFHEVYAILERSCISFLDFLKEKHKL
jgi:protein-tyrosine phosphatase